jgi:hypothetical protein
MSSSPEAEAAMLDIEPRVAGMVASWGVANGKDGAREWVGGSSGVELGVEVSLWWPEGLSGRRKVPLLGEGVRLRVSQIML